MSDNCIFCKIVAGQIPSRKVHEDELVYGFHDIAPWAPVHFLIIPKLHIPSMAQLAPEQYAANLGLTRAQTTQAMVLAEKYGAETQKVLMDLAGGMDPSKSFEAEAKLRAEYVNGTKGYTDVTEGYRRVKAASDNAQGLPNTSTSPACAPLLRLMREGCTKPSTTKP